MITVGQAFLMRCGLVLPSIHQRGFSGITTLLLPFDRIGNTLNLAPFDTVLRERRTNQIVVRPRVSNFTMTCVPPRKSIPTGNDARTGSRTILQRKKLKEIPQEEPLPLKPIHACHETFQCSYNFNCLRLLCYCEVRWLRKHRLDRERCRSSFLLENGVEDQSGNESSGEEIRYQAHR